MVLAQPERLPTIDQDLDRLAAAVAKHEDVSGEGILAKGLATHTRLPVDPFAEVRRGDGHQNPHLGGDLAHARPSRNPRAKDAKSAMLAPFMCMRTFAPLVNGNAIWSTQGGLTIPRQAQRDSMRSRRHRLFDGLDTAPLRGSGGAGGFCAVGVSGMTVDATTDVLKRARNGGSGQRLIISIWRCSRSVAPDPPWAFMLSKSPSGSSCHLW